MGKEHIVILGFGRVGGALALALRRAGHDVSALPRSEESLLRARKLKIPSATEEDLRAGTLAIIAVPDGAIMDAALALAPRLGRRCALIHCAGALPVSVLRKAGPRRALGSFHPLCAISSPTDRLEGHAVAIHASSPALRTRLIGMAKALDLLPLKVPDESRAAYHAAAVLSAGSAVALLSTAVQTMETTGVSRADATDALIALMRSALNGVEARGLERGLTGPIVRGDAAVVAAHLEAIPADVKEVYLALSRRSLALVRQRLDARDVQSLARLLTDDPKRKRRT